MSNQFVSTELLTLVDAAHLLGISRLAVYSLVTANPPRLVSLRIGSGTGKIRITRRAVEDMAKRLAAGTLVNEQPPAAARHWRSNPKPLLED